MLNTTNETAGTAGRGYLTPSQPHPWAPPRHLDPGLIPACATCGSRNRDSHLKIPTQRNKEQR